MSYSLTQRLVAAIALGLLIPLITMFIEFTHKTYIDFLPRSSFFTYEHVIPSKEKFAIGEELQFISVSEVKRTVNFYWEDILFCDFGEGFGYFSTYKSNKSHVEPYTKKSTNPWSYQGKLPKTKSSCYLRSFISHKDKTGAVKNQILDKSPVFSFY